MRFVKIVLRHPYKISYEVRDDKVEIVHIRRSARWSWTA